ncbi:transposase, partial [Frankia umida]|uniref:transposase n=1 Tax=Frankia umida TaxID=573489 RepID=UPI0027E57B32
MKTTALYPSVRVDVAGRGIVSHAGGLMLTETVRASGLGQALSAALAPWRPGRAVHDPGKVLCDLALSAALGGDCLADVSLLRAEPAVFGRVASDPTVSRTVDRLAGDADRALKAIDAARAVARARVWELAGTHAPHAGISGDDPLVVDLDATLVTAHSEKEKADRTWKK